jgi:hypothetical protein
MDNPDRFGIKPLTTDPHPERTLWRKAVTDAADGLRAWLNAKSTGELITPAHTPTPITLNLVSWGGITITDTLRNIQAGAKFAHATLYISSFSDDYIVVSMGFTPYNPRPYDPTNFEWACEVRLAEIRCSTLQEAVRRATADDDHDTLTAIALLIRLVEPLQPSYEGNVPSIRDWANTAGASE